MLIGSMYGPDGLRLIEGLEDFLGVRIEPS
jgi:hypothetical protein